jgi:hypothetical protein
VVGCQERPGHQCPHTLPAAVQEPTFVVIGPNRLASVASPAPADTRFFPRDERSVLSRAWASHARGCPDTGDFGGRPAFGQNSPAVAGTAAQVNDATRYREGHAER